MNHCLHQVAELEAEKKAEKVVALAEEEAELQANVGVKNGSRDKWGNLRKNVGGRPRKLAGSRKDDSAEQHGRGNVKRPQDKSERQELKGPVQLKIVDELSELAKGFGESAGQRTQFWAAAKPIIGDLQRKRVKKMMHKRQQIETRCDKNQSWHNRKVGKGLQSHERLLDGTFAGDRYARVRCWSEVALRWPHS